MKSLRAATVVAGAAVAISSCSAARPNQASRSTEVHGSITVFAAASLLQSFTTLGQQFEKFHPGTTVTFSFGPSSGLAQQIIQGAPADVFASASPKNMNQVVTAGEATASKPFAGNVMQIAVPPDNPARITRLADLATPGVKVALCQAAVPCGTVAAQVFAKANLKVTPVTQEADVKAVLSKVRLGEVDAGVVYVTDVRAAGAGVRGVAIPAGVNASTTYPIAVLKDSPNPVTAQAFIDLVLSRQGRSVLEAAGFTAAAR